MKTRANTALLLVCVLFGLLTPSCDKKSTQSTNETSNQPTVKSPPPVTPVKHYQLKGKVVSIDKQGKMLNVDSEAIPGFMDAMTMPYKVKPESELDKLHPGDVITADLLVQDEGAWLENISVTGHSSAPATK
jgi:Cu/Ag efflux protein CusF